MHTLELKIDDNSLENVLQILYSLKDGMIKEINIDSKSSKSDSSSHLDEFQRLIKNSDNKEKLTLKDATNIDEAVDGIF
jgi:hypothetical protein